VVSFTSRSLPQEKSPWYSLGGPQSWSVRGGEEKNSQPLPGFELPIIQSLAQLSSLLKKFPAFRKPKVYQRVHKSPPLGPVLSQLNPVYTGWPWRFLPLSFCEQKIVTYAFMVSSMHASCSVCLIRRDLISLTL
jgi:hypothetical protein